eukprot:Clim_evm48s88 gene=Clim_evmTU48s88
MPLDKLVSKLRELQIGKQSITEVLVLSGEIHPKHNRRKAWFEHIFEMCKVALSMGFLPHANVGPLLPEEMNRLASVNASMGLMLEQATPRLMRTVHRNCPSKVPEHRIQQIEMAGRLGIPFTTGVLLGLGETDEERRESLTVIGDLALQFGHIQECIIQPFSPGSANKQLETAKTGALPPFPLERMPEIIKEAKEILPHSVRIQVPPNLVQVEHRPTDKNILVDCIHAGACDLGGISPLDEVNADYGFPSIHELTGRLAEQGIDLQERLPLYKDHDQLHTQHGRTEIALAIAGHRQRVPQ